NMTTEKKVHVVEIDTKKLSRVIEENNLGNIDLMKIDVETHEVEVLEGMGKYLETMQPDMLIEIQNPTVAHGISELISNIDYLFFNINEKGGVKQVSRLEQSDTLNFLICKRDSAQRLGLI